jgi:hypothetical protein
MFVGFKNLLYLCQVNKKKQKMKNLLSILLVSLVFASCTQVNPYQEQAVEHLRRQMKNPDSFRMDSLKYETFLLSDGLKADMSFDSLFIQTYGERADYYKENIAEYGNLLYMSDLVVGYKQDYKNYKSKVDSVTTHQKNVLTLYNKVKGTDQDTIILHRYRVYYMAQNSFGAMLKGQATVDTENGVKFMVDVKED